MSEEGGGGGHSPLQPSPPPSPPPPPPLPLPPPPPPPWRAVWHDRLGRFLFVNAAERRAAWVLPAGAGVSVEDDSGGVPLWLPDTLPPLEAAAAAAAKEEENKSGSASEQAAVSLQEVFVDSLDAAPSPSRRLRAAAAAAYEQRRPSPSRCGVVVPPAVVAPASPKVFERIAATFVGLPWQGNVRAGWAKEGKGGAGAVVSAPPRPQVSSFDLQCLDKAEGGGEPACSRRRTTAVAGAFALLTGGLIALLVLVGL